MFVTVEPKMTSWCLLSCCVNEHQTISFLMFGRSFPMRSAGISVPKWKVKWCLGWTGLSPRHSSPCPMTGIGELKAGVTDSFVSGLKVVGVLKMMVVVRCWSAEFWC